MMERSIPYRDLGPVQPGEETDILAGVERFLEQSLSGSKPLDRRPYRLSDAPPGLIRRFLLYKTEGADSWIPWRELPPDLFHRAKHADECKRKIYQAQRYNYETGNSNLTPEDILTIYAREKNQLLHFQTISPFCPAWEGDFDLHDVYVCSEATILNTCEQWEQKKWEHEHGPGLPYNPDKVFDPLTRQFETVVRVIGQAIQLDASPGQHPSLPGPAPTERK